MDDEGFTGFRYKGTYGGAVKPRSSLDVTELRSVKSMDDEGFTGFRYKGTYGGAVKPRLSLDVDEFRSSKSMDDDCPLIRSMTNLQNHNAFGKN